MIYKNITHKTKDLTPMTPYKTKNIVLLFLFNVEWCVLNGQLANIHSITFGVPQSSLELMVFHTLPHPSNIYINVIIVRTENQQF